MDLKIATLLFWFLHYNPITHYLNLISGTIETMETTETTETTETIGKRKTTDNVFILIDKELQSVFKTASVSIGFIPAIDKILQIYDSMDSKYSYYDRREIIFEPLENIQYLNDKEISASSMLEISNGLENLEALNDSDKSDILYHYFKSIYLNELINKRVRNNLLEDLIKHVSNFNYSDENDYDSVKQKSLLLIVRDFVLVNKEIEDAEDILIQISKVFYSGRLYQSNKLFETIAIIYLAIYLYSEYETETLVKEHREKLKSLIHAHEQNIHTSRISFNAVINTFFMQIVKALWNLSDQDYKNLHFIEYFPPQAGPKATVWGMRAGINFATFNYLLSYYDFEPLPYKMINNWDKLENKRIYIESLLKLFDYEDQVLTESNRDKMNRISEWVGIRGSVSLDIQKEMFEKLNKEMQLLEENELEKVDNNIPKVDEINILLKEKLSNSRNSYGYNASIKIEEAQEMHFRPLIMNLQHSNNSLNLSTRLARSFKDFLNEQIKKELPEVQLSFDLEGVEALLNKLKNKGFNKRNYTYIDDLALKKEVRGSAEYQELVELIKNISFEKTKPINSRMFFKDDCLEYNIKITGYNLELLTDDECSDYVEKFKVGVGLYKLQEAYLNKSKAMELIKEGYRKELVSFRYNSNLNSDCGIRIGFKSNR